MTEVSERIAKLLWERFAPEHETEWPPFDAAEYRSVADEVVTAALAVAPKPRVKALEWAPFGDGMFTAKAPPIGTYAIEDGYLPLKLNGHTIGRHESAAEAKAAAQADYEARILSALEDGQ